MIVVVIAPHNDGVGIAVVTGVGFDSDKDEQYASPFVDLYEVDASVHAVATEEEVQALLDDALDPGEEVEWQEVTGGRIGTVER